MKMPLPATASGAATDLGVIDDGERLRAGQGAIGGGAWHEAPGQKHDAEGIEADDQQRMTRVLPGDRD